MQRSYHKSIDKQMFWFYNTYSIEHMFVNKEGEGVPNEIFECRNYEA